MAVTEKRQPRGFMGRGLGFWYYWLDLYGPDGTPANSKVLSAFGFFVALLAEVWWGWNLSKPGAAGINWPFVFLVVATLAVAMGKNVFKATVKLRSGGGSNGNYALQARQPVHRDPGDPGQGGQPPDPSDAEEGHGVAG